MKTSTLSLALLISVSVASATHDTVPSGGSGGGSWIPLLIILAVFGGAIWAFWTFVVEDKKF